jgi:hypothetical protein
MMSWPLIAYVNAEHLGIIFGLLESIRCGLVGGLCVNDRQRKVARIPQQVIDALGWLADETLAADCLTVLEPRRNVDGRGESQRGFS